MKNRSFVIVAREPAHCIEGGEERYSHELDFISCHATQQVGAFKSLDAAHAGKHLVSQQVLVGISVGRLCPAVPHAGDHSVSSVHPHLPESICHPGFVQRPFLRKKTSVARPELVLRSPLDSVSKT